jgi:hypothetical protein
MAKRIGIPSKCSAGGNIIFWNAAAAFLGSLALLMRLVVDVERFSSGQTQWMVSAEDPRTRVFALIFVEGTVNGTLHFDVLCRTG